MKKLPGVNGNFSRASPQFHASLQAVENGFTLCLMLGNVSTNWNDNANNANVIRFDQRCELLSLEMDSEGLKFDDSSYRVEA
jgi:hypothetical protein